MRYNGIASVVLTAALIFMGCSGQNDGEDSPPSSQEKITGEGHGEHAKMGMDVGEHTDESIYNVTSSWKNRHGEEINLGELSGKTQVLAMVYTHCEHACPRILADMKRIRDALSDEALDETRFLIVSIDPERDTPDRLAQFAGENDLSEEQWTLLNGGQGDVLELAALLGVKYKRISDTDFTHSNMISVLNKEGEVVHQRKKLEDQQTAVINAIEQNVSD